jgi:hypothetical protein
MKKAAGVLLLVLLAARAAGAQPAPALDATGYRAQIDRLLAALDDQADQRERLGEAAKSLPRVWVVRVEQQQFTIPIDWLRTELRRLSARPDAKDVATVRTRLRQLRADLDAYEAPPRPAAAERRRLDGILARPEFGGVRGPTWFDRLKQRVLEYLANFLVGVWGSSSFPTIANIVVWALVGLAVLVTGFWIYRSLRRTSAAEALVPDVLPVSAKAWSVWLAEARQAAAAGEWRDAVRLAYWSGISWLESARVWPPDRARTPREYLRLLPAESAHRPALSSLTRTFELAWYARQDADATTFSQAVEDLENLGCRPG